MNNEVLTNFLNQSSQVNLSSFLSSIFFAAILSVLVQIFYLKYSKSFSDKISFSKNFVILGVTTTIVITIVKSSLALSLGLVGALSIVRFRAAIKDPEELVYLFLIIAIGLGCGAGQIYISIVGTLFSLFLILIYFLFDKKNQYINEDGLNLTIIISKKLNEKEIDLILSSLNNFTKSAKFISYSVDASETNLNFEIIPKNFKSINQIFSKIKSFHSKSKFICSKKSDISI